MNEYRRYLDELWARLLLRSRKPVLPDSSLRQGKAPPQPERAAAARPVVPPPVAAPLALPPPTFGVAPTAAGWWARRGRSLWPLWLALLSMFLLLLLMLLSQVRLGTSVPGAVSGETAPGPVVTVIVVVTMPAGPTPTPIIIVVTATPTPAEGAAVAIATPTPASAVAAPVPSPTPARTPLAAMAQECSAQKFPVYKGAELKPDVTDRIQTKVLNQDLLMEKTRLAYELTLPRKAELTDFRFYATEDQTRVYLDFYRAQASRRGCLTERDVFGDYFLAVRDASSSLMMIFIPVSKGELPPPDDATPGFLFLAFGLIK